MNFKNSRRKVLGTIFRKYVFDLHGNTSGEFNDSDGRRCIPVVLPFDAIAKS